MGFCFDPTSSDFIHPRDAQQIIKWLEGPKVMGEFHGQTAAEIRETALILDLKGIQIGHGFITEDYLSIPLPKIIEIEMNDDFVYLDIRGIIENLEHTAEYILLNFTPHYGDWNNFLAHGTLTVTELEKLCAEHRIMLGSRFTLTDIEEIQNVIRPAALNITTVAESKTGEKDFEPLDEVLHFLREA